jgi:predicted phage terminase large subunit-like protein
MLTFSKEEIASILRTDFVAFVQRSFYELNRSIEYRHNWHIEVIAEALEKCRIGQLHRLVINLPPRSLKSHMVSISFVAWLLAHRPSARIIVASYAQDLADKLAGDCRSVMLAPWYRELFPGTRFPAARQALHDLSTTQKGFRLATSVGGVLTGRGANYIIVDDPLKPDEALSESRRRAVNAWFDHSLISRLDDKREGCMIIIMQRLHEDDLVGHVLQQPGWCMLKFPAIAEEGETHAVETPYGRKVFRRRPGEALHPEREPLEVLAGIREIQGEYTFAGQYQQSPTPLGGGMVKAEWFKAYTDADRPPKFDLVFQSWDTANKPSELSDYSVGTTWGVKGKNLYLLHVYRKRVGYPELKRAVREQAEAFDAKTVLIEDRASGTQLIQDLMGDGMRAVQKYDPTMDKTMRMHSVTSTMENGFVYLPEKAAWVAEYVHEMVVFPNGKYDDQADSTSQALDWSKNKSMNPTYGVIEYYKRREQERLKQGPATIPPSMPCPACGRVMSQRIPNGLRCVQCGAQWSPPGVQYTKPFTRAQFLSRGRLPFG